MNYANTQLRVHKNKRMNLLSKQWYDTWIKREKKIISSLFTNAVYKRKKNNKFFVADRCYERIRLCVHIVIFYPILTHLFTFFTAFVYISSYIFVVGVVGFSVFSFTRVVWIKSDGFSNLVLMSLSVCECMGTQPICRRDFSCEF